MIEIAKQVQDGTLNPLEGLAKVKEIQKQFEEELEKALFIIMPDAISELEKYGGSAKLNGRAFSITSGGRYIYSADEEYKKIEEQLKKRAAVLLAATKAYSSGNRFITDDGEEVLPVEFKPNKTSISVK
jgi:hypothetical protein